MGLAWIDGSGRGREPGRRARTGVPKNHTDRKRAVGRSAVHGYGVSAGVLFALSWLLEVLSALGVGAVSEFEKHQQQGGRGRDVIFGAGAAAFVDNSCDFDSGDRNSIDPRPVLIITGLVQEARIAAGPGMIVICSSSDPQQLRALLATLDSSTFRGVISFGVAGGLDPSLKSGDIVVATEVLAGDTRFLAGLALNEEMIGGARTPAALRALVSTGVDFNRALRSLRGCRGFLGGESLVAANA